MLLFHIWLSMVTLIVLGVAGLQAVLLAMQERLLRLSPNGPFIRKLPPLVTMEKWLFRTIIVGFVSLSLLLVTSFYEFHQVLWQHFLLWQKIILVMLAWIIFALLLIGRYVWGWRGRKAIYGTVFGVLLLVIVSIGSEFILEGWC